jgi:glycosyltransferase involved in cell wall biosynthesis
MQKHKNLLLICVYPASWRSTGKDANDSWKYIPAALSKKCKVVCFSFEEHTLTKRYFFRNILTIVNNYICSPLVIFEPVEGKLLGKLHWHLLLFLLSLNKKIVVMSSLPDENIFRLTRWHRAVFTYDCTGQMCDMNDEANDLCIKENEGKFIKKCDLTFVNSRSLFTVKQQYSSGVKVVPAGFPMGEFLKPTHTVTKHDTLTAVYIGAISFRFDFILLKYVVQNNPDIDFIFIGPYLNLPDDWIKKMDNLQQTKRRWHEILSMPNVRYLGYMDRKNIHAISSDFDVGIIPYDDVQEFNRYCNPVKFYDYLAMGKPVVSTDILELRRYKRNNNIKIAHNKYEFDAGLNNDFRVTDRYKRHARTVALKNDVEHKVSKIISEIYRYLTPRTGS